MSVLEDQSRMPQSMSEPLREANPHMEIRVESPTYMHNIEKQAGKTVKLHRLYLPAWKWLRQYDYRTQLAGDVNAGIITSVFLIPQGMAYAVLAGLPPVYGLYTSIFPVLIYSLLGTSRESPVAAIALVSIMLNTAASGARSPGESMLSVSLKLSLLAGAVQVAIGMLRLGAIINYVSFPVMTGFNSAGSVLIVISQLKYVFGLKLPPSNYAYETLRDLFVRLPQSNWYAFMLSSITLLVLSSVTLWKRWSKPTGTPRNKMLRMAANFVTIVTIIVLTGVSYAIETGGKGVKIPKIGAIPSGFRLFSPFDMSMDQFATLTPSAILIGVVSFLLSFGTAKKYASSRGYQMDANQDLVAMGAGNLIGACLGCFVSAVGVSRTAVNAEAGATSQLSCMVSVVMVVLALQFLTPVLYWIPLSVLAGTIIVAVSFSIDYDIYVEAFRSPTPDFAVLVVTSIVALVFNIDRGIMAGVGLSILILLYQASFPTLRILVKPPGDTDYRDIIRYPEATEVPGIKVVRVDESITFINGQHVKDSILSTVTTDHQQQQQQQQAPKQPLRYCVVDSSAVNRLDMSSTRELADLEKQLKGRGIVLRLARAKGAVRDVIKARSDGLYDRLGGDLIYLGVEGVVMQLRNGMEAREEERGYEGR